jgi:hypothetical protein
VERKTEWALRRWKRIAFVAFATSGLLLAVLLAVIIVLSRPARQTDSRLIGTWQSDADRTIAEIRKRRPVDEKQEAAFRKLFGKLRVTYTATTCTSNLEAFSQTNPYEVLGKDNVSVVIREVEPKSPILGEMTEFTVIQFDGLDSYWLFTKIGGIQEYFNRVK